MRILKIYKILSHSLQILLATKKEFKDCLLDHKIYFYSIFNFNSQ